MKALLAFLTLSLFIGICDAHPWRLDQNGGHHDRKNGGYHKHR